MAMSMKNLDPAFQGAGQKAGIEIWRIENLRPVSVPQSSYGKFFTGDSYVILKTTSLKSGAFGHDIHYWLGKDTSQDESGVAAIKSVELDAKLGGRAVQYREVQGHETEKFLSYFKPCIIPQKGGVASGFKHAEINESKHEMRLFVSRGKHVVRVEEVPFARSSLSHDDIFILDTKDKVFQFNGFKSSIQEKAKALEVVQYLKDTYHDGKCDIAVVEDGRLMADAEAGEFWGYFGGFAPLPRKVASVNSKTEEASPPKLLCVGMEQPVPIKADLLSKELLEANKCYLLDCGIEVFVWLGRNSPLDKRKNASAAAEELVRGRPKSHLVRVVGGFETTMFRLKFDSWPQTGSSVSEGGRGKVAALLKFQGLDVKGLSKDGPVKEEPEPYIDCTGDLQVWRVNGHEKTLLSSSDQSKFYTGDCYIFQYSYPGEDREEYLIGTWFGKNSIEEERETAILLVQKMMESSKSQAVLARLYEEHEPIQFFLIVQRFILCKGGVSSGYKNFLTENNITDETYSEDGTALFRIQGSGPYNMQAIQVEAVASSLNSSYCYILHSGSTVFTWTGSYTTSADQDLIERQLDLITPSALSKSLKEGAETLAFWDLLRGKCEYPIQKITRQPELDPHLFSCDFSEDDLKVTEIFSFTQDDLMTEEILILDCHSDIFVWIGQLGNAVSRSQGLKIGEKFIKQDFLLENLSQRTPIFVITEGNEPQFFTRFFTWNSSKSSMHGNSYERKFASLKDGGTAKLDKPKRRMPVHGGRSSVPDRSRSMSFSPDKARMRGRSPAFNALAAKFENPNARNLSMPPPLNRKVYSKAADIDPAKLSSSSEPTVGLIPTKFGNIDPAKLNSRSEAIAALAASFERPRPNNIPRSPVRRAKSVAEGKESPRAAERIIKQHRQDGESEEEKFPIFPYERLTISSTNPISGIDITRREAYLSAAEFREKFEMSKEEFYKLPKWKQSKLKLVVHLF